MKKIDLVVPCFNEEESLEKMYSATRKVVKAVENYEFSFIFVNDGSRDRTLEIIKSLSENDQHVSYISFSRNFGKEAALFAGLEYSSGDYVATIDADLQDPPELLPEMIQNIEAGYDCCATRRVTRKGEPPIRSFFARRFYRIINKLSNIEIIDGARDYRLMSRQMVDALLSLGERERFSKGLFSWVGFDTKWIEYENVKRAAGETKWSFWSLFQYAIGGIAAFTTVPLRISSFLGFFVSLLSFLYLIFIVVKTLVFGIDVPGYASTATIILFFCGLTLLALGIIGEYLARTYIEVKNRPLFIVKEKKISK